MYNSTGACLTMGLTPLPQESALINSLLIPYDACLSNRVMKATAKGVIPGKVESTVAVKMLKGT